MTEHNLTLPLETEIEKFSILTLTEYENLIQIEPETLALAKMNQPDNVELGINEIISQKTSPSEVASGSFLFVPGRLCYIPLLAIVVWSLIEE